MNCLLHFVAACLFDPSGVYVTAQSVTPINDNHKAGQGLWCGNRWCPGEVGVFEVGVETDLTPNIRLRYGLRHESMLWITNDRGQEFAFLGLTWRPFR